MEDGTTTASCDVLKALKALKRAAVDVQSNPGDAIEHNSAVKTLLELHVGTDDILAGDSYLDGLSLLLSRLKDLVFAAKNGRTPGSGGALLLRSIIRRRSSVHGEISQVSRSISGEIQSWIDREITERLVTELRHPPASKDDDERASLLSAMEERLAQGFNRGLQDSLLRADAFAAVESTLADPTSPESVRESAASTVLSLVRFNKAVFVGPVLMGSVVAALVSMSSSSTVAIRALNGLIGAIRSPLIDELLARGLIPRLVGLLSLSNCSDLQVCVLALDCALAIAYYGRKEAIDAMLSEGVIKRLMALQRSSLGGALIEMDGFAPSRPFASCVSRWSVQLEVGEGLRQRERRSMKIEIVGRLKEAAICDAEAATVLAEVLWGSTTW